MRGANPTNARTAERQLLAAMRDNPCLSVIALANAAAASRSTTGERLRRLRVCLAEAEDASACELILLSPKWRLCIAIHSLKWLAQLPTLDCPRSGG